MRGVWRERFVPGPDGTRLYLRERAACPGEDGRRPPATALLCDGIACDGFIWRYLADDLEPLADVVHWNYRGHGRSAAPVDSNRVDMAALVGDLEAIRAAAASGDGDRRLILFGHSLGCQVALEGFRRNRERVAAMVLICGSSGRVTHTFKGNDALARTLPRLIERVERHPQLARALWSNLPPATATRVALATGEVDTGIDPADLLPYMEHVANLDLAMFLRMLAAVGEESAEDVLPTVDVPVLVIAGDRDTFTPAHLAEKMASSLPQGELMLVRGGTHVVPLERREEVAERVTSFLRERILG